MRQKYFFGSQLNMINVSPINDDPHYSQLVLKIVLRY
jgi:hypothetical protein